MKLGKRTGKRTRKIARGPAPVAQNGGDSPSGECPISTGPNIRWEMRRQRRPAEQPHCIAHVRRQPPHMLLFPFDARDKDRGAQPAVLYAERIELGVTAHENDGKLPMSR